MELPTDTWWGGITGSNAKNYNKEIEKNQVNNINKFETTGTGITNIYSQYGADSKKFTKDKMGDEYGKEIGKVENAFNQEKANAMSRATSSGASTSSSAMFSQTKGEGLKQEALTSKENEMQQEALKEALAPLQSEQYNAQAGFNMTSSMQKKEEGSIINKIFEGGMSALGSAIPYF